MRDILRALNLEVGVKGSLVLTRDGIPVHSEIAPPMVGDVVAAVAGNCIREINGALKASGAKEFGRFIFNSSFGKMAFVDTESAYLAVVLDKSINLELTMLSITSAGRKIQSMGL
jgi:predicted regulator of Ras-like GTPase activity (Roadblock/LC7/MglB family)